MDEITALDIISIKREAAKLIRVNMKYVKDKLYT